MALWFIAYTFILENGRKRFANTGTYTCTDTEHARHRGTQARNIFFKVNILLVRKKKHLKGLSCEINLAFDDMYC